MRIVIIVDGDAEFTALKWLKPRLHEQTGHDVIGPVRSPIHPLAKPSRIARVAAERISELGHRDLDRAVLLLDRENRAECPGDLADSIARLLQSRVTIPVFVVIKDRTFENWLVADVAALQAMPARYRVSRGAIASIAPNRADHVDALDILRQAAIGRAFHKVRDASQILERADIDRIAANSRSFRRFLRALEYPHYLTQSRMPVPC